MSALLFGSISALADTSELQRAAFNQAFADHGLDWDWDQDEYRSLLTGNGGATRVAEYARSRGETMDAEAVHAAKSTIFQKSLTSAEVSPRPGVVETIKDAKAAGFKVGFVTTTSSENITALLAALEPDVKAGDFDLIVDASQVDDNKPDPASYLYALDELGESARSCIAVEDNVGGVQAASAAGVTVVPFPNENTSDHDFGGRSPAVDQLVFEDLKGLLP